MKKYIFAFALLICGFVSAAVTMAIDDGDIIKKYIKIRVNGKVVEYPIEDVDSIFFADSVIHIPVIKEVKFSTDILRLEEGQIASLTYKVLEEDADQNCKIEISDESILKYEKNIVTALSQGIATIIATAADNETADTCIVIVDKKPEPEIPEVESVILVDRDIVVGQTIYLRATILPQNAKVDNISWSSDNRSIATATQMDDNPLECAITARSAGNVKISCVVNGNVTATCTISVSPATPTPVSVTGITLKPTSLTLEVGSTSTLTAEVTPSNADNQKVSWSSSNSSVAKVSTDGVVTAVAAGSANITVKSVDGGYQKTCSVTVNAKPAQNVPVSGISLNKESLSMSIGDNETLVCTVSPSDATNKSLRWTSSNENVATVNSSTGKVTAVSDGEATITVTSVDGNFTAQCIVTVNYVEPSVKSMQATGVTADAASITATMSGDLSKITEVGVFLSFYPDFANMKDKVVGTLSKNTRTINVQLGNLEMKKLYYYRPYFVIDEKIIEAEHYNSFTTKDSNPFPKPGADDMVDMLGDGVLWSRWNMGASNEKEPGGYYAWGDATGEIKYRKDYDAPNAANISGNPSYDIATKQWGSGWRLPYAEEFMRLYENCTVTTELYTNTEGEEISLRKLTSKITGNTIYLPRVGSMYNNEVSKYNSQGFYWTGEAYDMSILSINLFAFVGNPSYAITTTHAATCLSVRPVYGEYKAPLTPEEQEALDRKENETEAAGEAVQLGLSVRWASYNVGAKKPSDYGNLYSWGEVDGNKTAHGLDNYRYYEQTTETYSYIGQDIGGDREHDPAAKEWNQEGKNGKWRMPTDAEFSALVRECKWVWTTEDGVSGYRVYGKGDYSNNSIFLPAAGWNTGETRNNDGTYGNYWTSTVFAADQQYARYITFDSTFQQSTYFSRCLGFSIRPVKP